ncbi:helix-turn-helix domain-containing protein [Microbacterium sp. PA5]|uniref:helix-turn-helix domain-containing protein n=1 Tax=Microbacterium sp. PA5 TaxID=3416654 RepID=UPI003CF0E98B
MRDLLARLAQSDEAASAALRVFDYFDALDASGVGPEAYVRGAAALSSCRAGMMLQERRLTLRIAPSGERMRAERDFVPQEEWLIAPAAPASPDVVWLETPERSTFHELILERVAQGVQRWLQRMEALVPEPAQAWAMLLNDPVPGERRQQLFAALRLDSSRQYQVVAHVPAAPDGGLHAYTTVQGAQVVATIRPAPFSMEHTTGAKVRYGIGPAVEIPELLDSWERAVVVLRLARQGEALPWDKLGVLAPLFLRAKPEEVIAEPIVRAIDSENMPWLDQTITAVTQTGSVRGAADLLGLHHSTVQKRIDKVQQQFSLNLANARHVYHLWLACAAHRYATFGRPDNMAGDVRLTPRPFDHPQP